MQNRVVVLSCVVVVAIFIGVTLVVSQTNGPIMQRVVSQQSEILELQKEIIGLLKAQAAGAGPSGLAAAGAGRGGALTAEDRVVALERKIDSLVGILSGARQAAQRRQGPPPEDYTKVYDIPAGNSPVRGPKEAPVTIVSFVDFQCPYSARFQPVIDEIMAAYPQDVNFVVKHFPLGFHDQAKPAVKAVLSAGKQGKYWEMMDLILKGNRALSETMYEDLAKKLGLDVAQFKKDIEADDEDWERIIDRDRELGGGVDVRGTPTYFLNGRKTKARDVQSFKKEIDEILGKK